MKYVECNIKGFEGLYHIYEDGVIYSVRKQRALKQYPNNTLYKYMYVCLVGHDRQELRTGVHRIVAHHFIGEQPNDKYEINHKDLNKQNNHYTNLEWLTHSQNLMHARDLKKWNAGRKIGSITTEEAKKKMSEKKKKKVLLFNDNQEIIYDSVEDFCTQNNTYRKKFERLVNSHVTFNGFYVRFLSN